VSPAVNRRQFITNLAALPILSQRAANRCGLRVAAMDWALAETMIALGHRPIAIVAANDWNRFVVEPSLPAGIVDLGLQPEINFELLASLDPDLILTSPFNAVVRIPELKTGSWPRRLRSRSQEGRASSAPPLCPQRSDGEASQAVDSIPHWFG
jgi:hypothetical protein